MNARQWIGLVMAVLVSVVLTGIIRRYAIRSQLLDIPNARSSHTRATPRGGGLSIVLLTQMAVVVLGFLGHLSWRTCGVFLIGGTAVALVGFLDDRNGLSPTLRLGVHFAAACLAVWAIGGTYVLSVGSMVLPLGGVGSLLATVSLTWFLNLYNFMDGIDGLAAAEAICITAAVTWLLALVGADSGLIWLTLILGGSSLGFLVWNWAPARIFMGDAGSGYLGYTIGVIALLSHQAAILSLATWLILAGVFVVDATMTLLRRGLRGERLQDAHNNHAYQRLARAWRSHSRVTITVILVNAAWLIPIAYWSVATSVSAPLLAGAALTPLAFLAWIIGAGTTGPVR